MAVIKVNHQLLRDVTTEINSYCADQDSRMRSADSEIKSMLTSGWKGLDAQEFGHVWESVDSSDSTTVKFRESLKKFGESLTACANQYSRAQEDSYNKAYWLWQMTSIISW